MKLKISVLFLAASVMASGLAFADTDDATWIAQCVADNKDEGASSETVMTYCKCMNNKMSSSEMQSISQWEETHPDERKDCEKKAGWE